MDKWILTNEPLCAKYLRLFSLAMEKKGRVIDEWNNGNWAVTFKRNLYSWESDAYNEIHLELSNVTFLPGKDDRLVWKHHPKGHFSTKVFYSLLDSDSSDRKVWFHSIWKLSIPPKIQCFPWLAILDSIPPKHFLASKAVHFDEDQIHCLWCSLEEETCSHILIICHFS